MFSNEPYSTLVRQNWIYGALNNNYTAEISDKTQFYMMVLAEISDLYNLPLILTKPRVAERPHFFSLRFFFQPQNFPACNGLFLCIQYTSLHGLDSLPS